MRIPYKYAAHVFGIIQSAITTGVATAIAVFPMTSDAFAFLTAWFASWVLAWATMLPIVVGFAPIIRRVVARMTDRE